MAGSGATTEAAPSTVIAGGEQGGAAQQPQQQPSPQPPQQPQQQPQLTNCDQPEPMNIDNATNR